MNFTRIAQDLNVMNGRPCIAGTRLTVSRVLGAIAAYPDHQELLRNYPELDDQTVRLALAYAAAAVDDRVVEMADAS